VNQKVSSLLATDPESIGGWKLIGRLGQGGYGTIYLASKKSVTVALKMISKEWLSDIDGVGQSRFANEAKILKELNHPNIAKIIDQNLSTSVPFIAIEYLEGQTLEAKVKESGPLAEQEWFEYFKSLLSALEYCHSKNVIHKDISPANIIITDSGPKLIDFGNSFSKGSIRLTQEGVVNGTPGFMSPEHYEGNDLSPEMDLFSLASVLAYAGTGQHAFTAKTKQEYRNKTKFEAPELKELNSRQRDLLTPLFYKDPKKRPKFDEINTAIKELVSNKELTSYGAFLIKSSEKIIAIPIDDSPKQKIKQLISIVIIGLLATVSLIIFFSQQSAEASECTKSYMNADYQKAITACAFEVAKGNTSAQITLGKAYKQANQEDQAKEVFAKCKNEFYECLHENAFFITDVNQARKDWEIAFNNGVSDSGWALAISYNKSGDKSIAQSWIAKAVARNNPIGKLMESVSYYAQKDYKAAIKIALGLSGADLSEYPEASRSRGFSIEKYILTIYNESKDDEGKMKFLLDCAKDNDYCIGQLAAEYFSLRDDVNAQKWAEKGVSVNDGTSMWVMGKLAERSYWGKPGAEFADTSKARYWYERSAGVGDVASMARVAEFAVLDDEKEDACLWANRLIPIIDFRQGSYDELQGDQAWKKTASKIIQDLKCGIASDQVVQSSNSKDISKITPTPSSSPIAKISDGNLVPLLKYESSEYSEKVSTSVKTSSIFGRAFLSGLNWVIPLTNSANESVPPINRVQFRNSTLPYGSWWNMPYTLKDGGSVGWQAEVSDVGIQLLHSTGDKVCPEFRLALVQNGLVTYIWTKSVAPCS
jgi:serine/threonine protein kinase